MNKDERLDLYLNLLQPSLPDWLSEIENSALKEKVPIIRKSVQHFFRWFLRVHKPKKILELGAGVGFSALFFLLNIRIKIQKFLPLKIQIRG